MRRLPPLTALPAFEATARLGSMTAAARELGRTHSAISKQVAHLEQALGAALFEPEGVGLKLTAVGVAYAAEVSDALGRLARATEAAAQADDGPQLNVHLSGALAARWLIPRLSEFEALRPDVAVRLQLSTASPDRWRDLGPRDMLLSWDRLGPSVGDLLKTVGPGAEALPVGDAAYGPVASPATAVRRDADGAATMALIDHAEAPGLWSGWQTLSGVAVTASDRHVFPNTLLCIEAAVAGLGATVVERRLVARELDAGALVAPFGFVSWPGGLVAVRRGRRSASAAAFVAWLRTI
jgi:LysR family glycine cleavage system transcriptional activator